MARRPNVLAIALAVMLVVAAAGVVVLADRTGDRGGRSRAADGRGREVFVAEDGDDSASGSVSAPLRTIAAAAQAAQPGDIIYVRSGTYDERVDFSSSGTAEMPITIEAYRGEAVTVSRGFRVTGDHNIIRGLTVHPGESDPSVFEAEKSQDSYLPQTAGQIQIVGSGNTLERISHHDEDGVTPPGVSSLVFLHGSNNTVREIDFHDCHTVYFAGNERETPGSGRYNTISGGTIHHTDRSCITIEADDSTVEGLDLHDTGQVDKTPEDADAADAVNLNGARITIRDCRIYRVFAQLPEQHTDAIQWWNQADDLVIEGNIIGSAARGGDLGLRDQGHIQWTSENESKTSMRVVIRNNVFLGTEVPYAINGSPQQTIPGSADEWRIVGNTFAGAQSIRPDLLQACDEWVISNNVFHSSGAFEGAMAGNRVSHNCYVRCDPSPGEGEGSFRVEDAGFADPDLSQEGAYGLEADWSPVSSSPLSGAGAHLRELVRDMAGRPRPDPPSIGALEPAGE